MADGRALLWTWGAGVCTTLSQGPLEGARRDNHVSQGLEGRLCQTGSAVQTSRPRLTAGPSEPDLKTCPWVYGLCLADLVDDPRRFAARVPLHGERPHHAISTQCGTPQGTGQGVLQSLAMQAPLPHRRECPRRTSRWRQAKRWGSRCPGPLRTATSHVINGRTRSCGAAVGETLIHTQSP